MKKNLLFLLLLMAVTFCFAQKIEKKEGRYSVKLVSVDNPKDIQKGKLDSITSTYEDDIIKINWQYAVSEMGFELTNKYDQTLKLVWDDAAFISTANESERVFHKGVKYIDREKTQSPTPIYKNTTISDLVAPISYTYYLSGQYGGWKSKPLIPQMSIAFSKKVEYRPELLGKNIRIALPLKIDEKTLEYVFVFKTVFLEKI